MLLESFPPQKSFVTLITKTTSNYLSSWWTTEIDTVVTNTTANHLLFHFKSSHMGLKSDLEIAER
ncbi:CLUMA_CG002032, isoform A [Clunio marinus]|uniref:CLUMA_CG002032, isoform A n=1 Tax=Clunio marinus TaxID=568069 RepID=A0A1J1HLG6_9DIPT|nr:CLUMA_CG002032, isoform A [Clunio marinus]